MTIPTNKWKSYKQLSIMHRLTSTSDTQQVLRVDSQQVPRVDTNAPRKILKVFPFGTMYHVGTILKFDADNKYIMILKRFLEC